MANTTDFNENSNKELVNIEELSNELILTKINNIRSNLQLLDYQDRTADYNNIIIPIKESFCHAFYRMLGLPVINSAADNFYSPGFYGNEQDVNIEARNNIDKNQHPTLGVYEDLRETLCYENVMAFERPDPTFTYRLDLLRERMTIDILDDNNNMFFDAGSDTQAQSLSARKLYTLARRILRPFKCSAKIVNNVYPITNSICAPFVSSDNSIVNSVNIPKSYLEFVIRTRISKDVLINSEKNTLYTKLQLQVKEFSLPQNIQNSINAFSDLENYITTQMLQSLFYICKKVGEETKNTVKIVEQLTVMEKTTANNSTSKESVSFDTIDSNIITLNAKIAASEMILSTVPNYTIKDANGADIAFQNYMDCPLISPFIKLVQPNIDTLKKELDSYNAEKQKRSKIFSSLNKSIFYTIGEVNGLGLIDIISIMLSFWIVPKENLLSMLDIPSFVRLYREPNLRDQIVEERHANGDAPSKKIKDVMIDFDKTIVQILKSCEKIIKENSV